jgi:hypothetical protein
MKKEMTQAILATTKTIGGHTVYPATYGLIFWLADVRKSPAMHGKPFTLADIAELCWAFTLPSEEVEKIPAKTRAVKIKTFMHSMTPDTFNEFQKHAESEILRYFNTAVTPKKPQGRALRPKVKMKR